MTELALSRRAVTRALVTLPMIAVPTLACAAGVAGTEGEHAMNMHTKFKATGRSAISKEYAALIQEWRETEARSAHHWKTIEEPALDAGNAAAAATPHYTTSKSYLAHKGITNFSTADPIQVAFAKGAVGHPFDNPDFQACAEELWSAHLARQAQVQVARDSIYTQAIKDRSNELSEISWEAREKVLDYTVVTMSELIMKVEIMEEVEVDIDMLANGLLDDLRRLAGEA